METDEEAFITWWPQYGLKDLEGAGEKDYVLEAGNTRPVGAEVYVSDEDPLLFTTTDKKADGHTKDVSSWKWWSLGKAFAGDKNNDGDISGWVQKWFFTAGKDRQDSVGIIKVGPFDRSAVV